MRDILKDSHSYKSTNSKYSAKISPCFSWKYSNDKLEKVKDEFDFGSDFNNGWKFFPCFSRKTYELSCNCLWYLNCGHDLCLGEKNIQKDFESTPKKNRVFFSINRIKQIGASLSALQLENRVMSWKWDHFWIDNIKIPLVKKRHNKSLKLSVAYQKGNWPTH